MAFNRLKAKIKGIKYLPFEQDGITYNLYDMPKGFVIKGNLDLSRKGLTELPDLSEVVVKRDFNCSINQLTSLEGAPKEVGGGFYCYENELTSLEGAPQRVGGDFWCYNNQLTSLEGAPQSVGGDFECYGNKLTSLEGAPKEVGGGFYCYENELTSLEGAPKEVGGGFSCHNNQLASLEGAPQEVGAMFDCTSNRLTSLEGAPKKVGTWFGCSKNQLTSLAGLPQMNKGYEIYCDDSLGNKYGVSNTHNCGISYEILCASPLYRSEDAMNRVRSKLPQEKTETQPVSTKQQEAFEKINSQFSQWLKDNPIKPTRE